MIVLAVAAAGAIGAPLRWVVDTVVTRRMGQRFPWGTLAVNLLGALVLGVLAGITVHRSLGSVPTAMLETGFCGALTTFSTFGYQTIELAESHRHARAVGNALGSVALGLSVAIAGFAVADAASG